MLDDVPDLLGKRQLRDRGREAVDQGVETAQRAGRAAGQRRRELDPGLPEAPAVVACVVAQEIERRAADAARGEVHETLEGDVVVARLREEQVRESVIAFGGFEETKA